MPVCRSALVFLLLLSPLVHADSLSFQSKEYLEALGAARADGFNEAITITALVLTFVGVIGSLAGYLGFKRLESKVTASIQEEIRTSECMSLNGLGLRYYNTCKRDGLHEEAKISGLNSAIAVTGYALTVCEKLSKENERKIPQKALLGTNLAYFFADLLPLLQDSALEEKCKAAALDYLGRVAFAVQILERNKHVQENIQWYNVLESSLNAEFRVTEDSSKRKKILEKLEALLADLTLPPDWRREIELDWEELKKLI